MRTEHKNPEDVEGIVELRSDRNQQLEEGQRDPVINSQTGKFCEGESF